MDGLSYKESFVSVPMSTVKGRLYESRKRLKKELLAMMDTTLKSEAPGTEFTRQVMGILELSSADELDEDKLITRIETLLSDLDALRCRKKPGEYLNSLTEKEKIAKAFLNIATHSEDKNIKSLAIAGLGYLQYTNAIQMLSDLAVSEEYNLFACEALGNIGTKESGEAILKHLEHARDWTKIDIVDALIKIGHPDFVEPLLKHHVKNCAVEGYIALPIAKIRKAIDKPKGPKRRCWS